MKRLKKMSKVGIVLLTLVICASVALAGTLLVYFVKIDVTSTTTSLLSYSEDHSSWSDAEELEVSKPLTGLVGGDDWSYSFWLNLSADADIAHTPQFHLVVENSTSEMIVPDDGINTYVKDSLDNTVTSYELQPNEEEQFTLYVELDECLFADSYTITLTIDNVA